jgi:hypothetical protein
MSEIIKGRPETAEEIAEREAWIVATPERERELIKQQRQSAYALTADPLFFKYQAGEATKQEWLDARATVVEQYPYPA